MPLSSLFFNYLLFLLGHNVLWQDNNLDLSSLKSLVFDLADSLNIYIICLSIVMCSVLEFLWLYLFISYYLLSILSFAFYCYVAQDSILRFREVPVSTGTGQAMFVSYCRHTTSLLYSFLWKTWAETCCVCFVLKKWFCKGEDMYLRNFCSVIKSLSSSMITTKLA